MMSGTVIRYLGWCAARVVRREKPRVIAIAGSVGKTSTKEAIAVALGAHEPGSNVTVAPENYNNELGVPLTILGSMAPGKSILKWVVLLVRATALGFGLSSTTARTFVLEYATDKPGDIAYLLSIARPNVAVLTVRQANPVALVRFPHVLLTRKALARLEEMFK